MKKQWTAYDEDVRKFVNLTYPEFVTLANGQKVIVGENADTGKLLCRLINSEGARAS